MSLACVVALALAATPVVPISVGNALTLPAQRHLVRMAPDAGPPIWLLAIYQSSSTGLVFWRSDDDTRNWRPYRTIQPDGTHHDRADLVPVGNDLALVYSFESSTLSGSTRHDVYFQWWRWQPATRDFAPGPAVRIFDSTSSSTGYYRGELEIDSAGRLWVQSFKLESDGTHTAALAVSTDGGLSFQSMTPLARLSARGGGRLIHLGTRMMFLFGSHSSSTAAQFRLRDDAAPLDSWQPVQTAFSGGIYHGAALSAAPTGDGGLHLVYKNNAEQLLYRRFNGTTFGASQLVLDQTDWAVQPAVTRVGDRLIVFMLRNIRLDSHYALDARVLQNGVLSPPVVLDDSTGFKGYPAAAEELPATVTQVPCFFGDTSDASSSGYASIDWLSLGSQPPPPPPPPPPGASLSIAQPNGGEVLTAGSSYTIRWLTGGTVPYVNLEYSTNLGTSWIPIDTAVTNAGQYAWLVPAAVSSSALVRVSDTDAPATFDVSDAAFTIRQNTTGIPVPFGSIWRYHDLGVDLGSTWLQPTYDDTDWRQGPGQLGYGEGDEATLVRRLDPVQPSIYFRKTFRLEQAPAAASVSVLHDDGFAMWVNGVKVFSRYVGNVGYSAWASKTSAENQISRATIPTTPFRVGDNTIQVMVKQRNRNSTDLSFDLELRLTQ